jgi:UDP-N-acetylmuramoyl-tripeptide--D-alanyl-D-alanine ligase
MLSYKYRVVQSPQSFNTPMGFCRTVLKELTPSTQVLIMEMGARRVGDIKTMCKLLKPHHGILTAVGKAHLETFKTIENIKKEKYELLNSIPENGIRVDGEKNVFTGQKYETKLLGEHNQQNISMCAVMARKLGITDGQIRDAVLKLKPVPHRLELIKGENGVQILDDSYNSSPHGAHAALRVLNELVNSSHISNFTRGSKVAKGIVMTPGMVELGAGQYDENRRFGFAMAKIASAVIIVGDTNKNAINDGLLEQNFDKSNIFFAPTVDEAKKLFPKLLSAGDCLLIENDLPDNY